MINNKNNGYIFDDVKINRVKNTVKTLLCANILAFSSIQAHAMMTVIDINTIVEKTIDKHPLVLSAKSEATATDEGITAARLQRFPEISLDSNVGTTDPVATITIQQPIWTGGRLDATLDRATYDAYAARATVEEKRYEVAKRALEAWQTFVSSANLKQVYARNLTELSRFEAMMKRRVDAQVSARIELDLVVNRILQSQDTYQGANEQQRIALSRLQQLVGEPISKTVLNQHFNLKKLANKVRQESRQFKESLIFKASKNHPSVIRSTYATRSAEAQAEAEKANTYPQLYARYQHQYDAKDNVNNDKFVVGFQYAPGAGFSSYALTRASKARVDGLKQNTQASQREIIEALQVDYQQFASARDRERALVAAVDGAVIVKESYERQFIAGRKSWLDVLNAVRELEQYEAQLVSARVNFIGSYYRLKLGIGLLPWQRSLTND